MARRKPGRLVHEIVASVKTTIPVKVTGIEFAVYHKWKKGKHRLVGTLMVNAGGLRWRTKKHWYPTRLTWEDVRARFEEGA